MNNSDRDMLLSLLKESPGPAPWYVRGRDTNLSINNESLAWVDADPDGPFHGNMVLEKAGQSLLFVKMYTIAAPVAGNRLLLAYKRKLGDVLALALFNADDFKEIEDPRVVCRILETPDQPYCSAIEPLAHVVVPRRITAGHHSYRFPAEFNGIGEILLVSTLVRLGTGQNEAKATAIFSLHPEEHRIEVIPQSWFNDGPYQHGFQWITRAARDPLSGRIVGEGIRLGYFLLNEEGDQVQEWLMESRSHMPQ